MGEIRVTNLTTNGSSFGGATALLLDNNAYDGTRADVTNSAENLVLNTEAFESEPEVCGTQCMDILAEYWHKVEKTTIGYREFMVTDVDKALETVQLSIVNTDKDIAASLSAKEAGTEEAYVEGEAAFDGKSGLYDDSGSYGGDQGDAYHNQSGFFLFWKNEWHFNYNKDLYDFVRQHPQCANMTDQEIRDFLKGMNEEGCGYVAVANSIFAQYEGRADEFEKTFGFSMYDKNGDFNYNKLIVDFYIETDNKFYMDSVYGKSALVNSKLQQFNDSEIAFKSKYGCDLYADSSKETYSDEAVKAVTAEVNSYTGTEYTIRTDDATNPSSRFNRADHYLKERGVTADFSITQYPVDPQTGKRTPDLQAIQNDLDAGREVIIGAKDFYLDDENGNHKYDKIEGGHAMSVTGVTDDGRLIVSSWGKKFYIDPKDSTIKYHSSMDIQE